jgi:hypothetical protein
MTPQEWFNYLDGTMPEPQRKELADRLQANTILQRELAAAEVLWAERQKKPGKEINEVVAPAPSPAPAQVTVESPEQERETAARGARISRKFALWFIILVFINVGFGVWYIAFRQKKAVTPHQQTALREQVTSAAQAAAQEALPAPTLDTSDVKIVAPAAQHDELANKIMALANELGGSAAKALADAKGFTVLADIPTDFLPEFRQRLVALGAPPAPPMPTPPPGESAPTKIYQVRLEDGAAAPRQ